MLPLAETTIAPPPHGRGTAMAVLVVLVAALSMPVGAHASSRQFSILQDDTQLLGHGNRDPEETMAEAKHIGADMVRTFVSWSRVSPRHTARRRPAGFNPGDPNDRGYDWSAYDAFVDRAERNGLKVFLTLSPPIPYWASEEPERCPHFIGGYRNLGRSCYWKPKPARFYQFAKAVAQRYAGRVDLYSIYNEPNLEHYLYPQLQRTRHGVVDVAAKRYRSLWYEGWKAIARYDAHQRNHVLFGETAAISSPMDTLRAALCLDPEGRPFRGPLRKLQGCSRPRRLAIGGFAHHPYAKDGAGSVFQRTGSRDSLPMAYLRRLHRLMDGAARYGRIPRGRGIYLTEFGFQSNPPDRERGLRLEAHARALNEAERLFFGDRRIKSVAQFELYDAPELENEDVYNTGLRFIDGRLKPAYGAYRMPLVVTRLSGGAVEVWGQARPAEERTRVAVTASGGRRGPRVEVARPLTNAAGYFRVRVRRRGAAALRYEARWTEPDGETATSRTARAGRRIRYLG